MGNLGLFAQRIAAARPDAPAVIAPNGLAISFSELATRARAMAGHFVAIGLKPGDRIALAMSNHPAFFEVLLGAWQAGMIVAPMNPRLHPREFAGLMSDCEARLCIATPDLEVGLSTIEDCPPLLVADSATYQTVVHSPHTALESAPGGNAPAWLFYTSGTTGKAKGATLTHTNLRAMVDSFLTDSGCAVDDAMLHTAPLSHAGGLLGLAYLERGLPQIILPTGALDSAALEWGLTQWGSASLFAVPTLVNRMIDPAFLDPGLYPRIAKIMFGGAPMYAEDLKRACAILGPERLWGGYGQGEAPCTIAHLPTSLLTDPAPHNRDELLGSVGLPRSGVEIRILDENGDEAAPGIAGEVSVCGAVVMSGYWNRPDATAEALVNGWLRTGDIGRIGATGLLTLVDRAKDMIIAGGSNIYPRELEEVLLTHPAIREVAVVGRPDPEWGELPHAYLVADAEFSPDELDRFCADHIARYKRPRGYSFVTELPKSSYGKVLKSALRDMLSENETTSRKETR